MNEQGFDRSKVTFAQAEGQEKLPAQLKTKQLSRELRAHIWRAMIISLEDSLTFNARIYPRAYYLGYPWEVILSDYWVERMYKFIDEIDKGYSYWSKFLKAKISDGSYIDVFDFIQFVLRHVACPIDFPDLINKALEYGRAAYRVFDRETIVPIADEIDAYIYQRALDCTSRSGINGARAHLRAAGSSLTSGLWADSVRESIHAVESGIKFLDPSASTLSSGLVKLEKSGQMNPNLKRAMNALYDYTSDEAGIRHAKVMEGTQVNEADAIYMLGACSAFITFLNMRLSG
jgi:hypothetical protein